MSSIHLWHDVYRHINKKQSKRQTASSSANYYNLHVCIQSSIITDIIWTALLLGSLIE